MNLSWSNTWIKLPCDHWVKETVSSWCWYCSACVCVCVLHEISYSQWIKQIGKCCFWLEQLNISYPTICYEALKWSWKPKVITSPRWMFCLGKKWKWICCYRSNMKLKLPAFKTQHYLLVENSKYLRVMVFLEIEEAIGQGCHI